MIPTIYNFSEGLQTPKYSFATLKDLSVRCNDDNTPQLNRTTRFVEAKIEWQGRLYMLCAPLSSSAIISIELQIHKFRRITSISLCGATILRNELIFVDSQGVIQYSDLLLQELPSDRLLSDVIGVESNEVLLNAVDKLQRALEDNQITINNVNSNNLAWDGVAIHPTRYYYLRIDGKGDARAFEELRHTIIRTPRATTFCDVVSQEYSTSSSITGHIWVGNCFEQLICVEDSNGYGYVDTSNNVVIPSKFLWADDFYEGRATVEMVMGMGLIDKNGNFIIPAIYEIVEYDHNDGTSQVKQNGEWALFDYMGKQMTEFKLKVLI